MAITLFNKRTDLNKLSMVIYSINVELQLLNSKMDELNNSPYNSKIIYEINSINQNFQNNLQNLKLMIEYDKDEIEILEVDDNDYISNNQETLETEDLELYKTEILSDLTREIEILDDDFYKTEVLEDLTKKIESLDDDKEDELDKLKYIENTITISLKEINEKVNALNSADIKEINQLLNNEVKEVNEKLQKRIKVLKIKKMIWTVLIIIFIIVFTTIILLIGIRSFQNYKVKKEIENLEQYVMNENNQEIIEITDSKLEEVETNNEESEYDIYYNQAYNNLSSVGEDLEKENDNYHNYVSTNILSIDFNELNKINSNTVGWIRLENTNVNYPFVQGNDNAYYLKHSYNNSNSYMGWIFLDYKNNRSFNDRNTVIYGHGLLNNTMFGSLRKAFNEEWYQNKDNQIVKIYTEKGFLLYQLFSIYTIAPEDYYIKTNFENDEEFQNFIDTIRFRSINDFHVDIDLNDKILTLSTCYDNSKRAVLHAKLLYKSY